MEDRPYPIYKIIFLLAVLILYLFFAFRVKHIANTGLKELADIDVKNRKEINIHIDTNENQTIIIKADTFKINEK